MTIYYKNYPHGPRIIRYRHQVRLAASLFSYLSIILIFGGMFLLTALQLIDRQHASYIYFQFFAVKSLILGVFLFVHKIFFLGPMGQTIIRIYPDRILTYRKGKRSQIFYEDIVSVDHFILGFLFGSFKLILKDGRKVSFTLALERPEYIIDGIYDKRRDLIGEEEHKKLRKKLVLADHSWARIYDFFKVYRPYLILFFGVLPFAYMGVLYHLQKDTILISSTIVFFIRLMSFTYFLVGSNALLFFLSTNSLFKTRQLKQWETNPDQKVRDVLFERRVYKVAYPISLLLLIGAFLWNYQTGANFYSIVRASNSFSHFGVEKGELFIVDHKYNCLSCSYSLEEGDHIIISFDNNLMGKKELGKIVGLPFNYVKVNRRDERDRFIASVEERLVPLDSLAVEFGNEGINTIVPLEKIEGRVLK